MKKSFLSIAGILSAAVLFSGAVMAAEMGQTEGGDIYRVRNVSTNGAFTDPATGTCGNTFQFKVRIHNPGPSPLTNVNVKATLPSEVATSHSSTVTVSSASAQPASTSDTAGVNLDKAAKLNYVAGSTELLDANNSKISTLGDTIFTSGVNIDSVGVSTQQKRFVQFSVKTDCPTTPPVTPPTTPPTTPNTPSTPVELPETGAAANVLAVLGLGAVVAAIAYAVTNRRNILG